MRRARSHTLRRIYDRLFAVYGPQRWWPAQTATEVVVGAILTQNTAWKNVERAIENLRRADCLTWPKLRDVSQARLARLIQPSGTYRVKAVRLKALIERLWEDHRGNLPAMLDGDLDDARKRLLAIHGIGPETADAILLYAGGRPTFVVDAYTRRILRRHFVIEADADYASVRALFHRSLDPDTDRETAVPLFNEYHALLVELGKRHCGARARCDRCPLADMPHDAEL